MILFHSAWPCWIVLMARCLFLCKATTDCCSREITFNFGEKSKMICGVSNSSKEVIWFKYGKIISSTSKTMLSSRQLNISCLESSDSGEYVCKDKVTTTYIDSYRLIVENPENMTYFHIYNQHHKKCVSRLGKQLFVSTCDLNQCEQKWSWTADQQIMSAYEWENSECISVSQPFNLKKITMDPCRSNISFQRWECEDGDLLRMQGKALFFNYGNTGVDIVLFTGKGTWSRWVKYSTSRSVCDKDSFSKEIISNFGEIIKMTCGASDASRQVVWFKNSERISESPKIEFVQGNLYIHCLESSDTAEYMCKDKLTLSYIYSYSLTVKNPGESAYFHIYNEYHQTCLSKRGKRIFAEPCDPYKCTQKWRWTPCQQIISAAGQENPKCISVSQLVNFRKVVMASCESNTSFQKWECNDRDLLNIQGKDLYLNYGNNGADIVLYTGSGSWSRWVDYVTRQPLCDKVLDQACCNNGSTSCRQEHLYPNIVQHNSTQRNAENMRTTPTLKQAIGIQVTRVIGKIKPSSNLKTSANNSNIGIIIGSVATATTLIFLSLVGFFLFRQKKRNRQFLSSFQELHRTGHLPTADPQTSPLEKQEEIFYIQLVDDWEISRENLTILEKILGSGQFGVVKQGLIFKGKNESEVIAVKLSKDPSIRYFSNRRSDSEIVAVKMLKDGATAADRSDFLTELRILKEVNKDPHPNVLQLIGACSTTEPLFVITEYCSGGNLRKFLLNCRVETKNDSLSYINQTSTITKKKNLKLAVDVASGMIHLASHKFVHRDLAARNILIGENDTAKISDFGLARDIKNTEVYFRTNQNLLPLKWMSLESLLHDRFTTSSDIWSFGILLHEIVTLGDEPYKGMPSHIIVNQVGSGYRMEKPTECSDKLYTLMRNCWEDNPDERPSFQEIHDALNHLLTEDEEIDISHY